MWFSSSDESDYGDTQPTRESASQPVYYFILLLLFWKAAFRISASSITVILRLIKYFLKLLGTAYNCVKVVDISRQIPVTLTFMVFYAYIFLAVSKAKEVLEAWSGDQSVGTNK